MLCDQNRIHVCSETETDLYLLFGSQIRVNAFNQLIYLCFNMSQTSPKGKKKTFTDYLLLSISRRKYRVLYNFSINKYKKHLSILEVVFYIY